MNLGESFRTALGALNANKMRSILTMLGVIIGVSAVIALIGLGNGFSASIEGEIEGLGSNVLFAFTDRDTSDYPTLTFDDIDALNTVGRTPHIVAVAGSISSRITALANGNDYSANAVGISPDYFQIFNFDQPGKLFSGNLFTEFDEETRARVAVIGSEVAKQLFDDLYPVGQKVKFNGVSYEILGVLAEEEGDMGTDPNKDIYIPISTARNRLGTGHTRNGKPTVNAIYVSAESSEASDAAINELTQVLREEHDIAYASNDDFIVQSQANILDSIGNILGSATLFIGIVAGISLLVGGIGIMNIMLVSVTERTREIGIRKALGALRRDILLQFMIESSFLSLIGGTIGIGLGFVFAKIGSHFAGFSAEITLQSIVLAVGFSVAVGLVFGIYPAWRAARLRPIDALRYE